MFCRPVFHRWVELEVLRGTLPSPENGVTTVNCLLMPTGQTGPA